MAKKKGPVNHVPPTNTGKRAAQREKRAATVKAAREACAADLQRRIQFLSGQEKPSQRALQFIQQYREELTQMEEAQA